MPALAAQKSLSMHILISTIGLLVALSACVEMPAPRPLAPTAGFTGSPHAVVPIDVDGEVARLRADLMREVPGVIVNSPEGEQGWIAPTQAAVAASGPSIGQAQLLVVVDRNPSVQQMRIVLARPDGAWGSLGGTKVSTGQMGRRDYYLTPTGVFLHTDAVLDWRAEGTLNPQHIRGLGLKGCASGISASSALRKAGGQGKKEYPTAVACDRSGLSRTAARPSPIKGLRADPRGHKQISRSPRNTRRELRASREGRPPVRRSAAPRQDSDTAGNLLVVVDSSEPPAARFNAPDDADHAVNATANSSKQIRLQL